MTTVTVNYQLSAAAIRRIAVETGDEPERAHKYAIDLTPFTPEQRAVILDARATGSNVIWLQTVEPKTYASTDASYMTSAEFDHVIASVDEVLAHLAGMSAARVAAEARQAELRDAANAEIIARATAYLESPEDNFQAGNLDKPNPGIWKDARGAAEAFALVDQARVKYQRALELNQESQKREKAEAEAAKAAKRAARRAWAEKHGSEHLRRALEAGYDAARLYYDERVAVEYPGYVYDHGNVAGWKARSLPSLEALDELAAVKAAHPDITASGAVWLTVPPGERDDDHDFEECEAVAVQSPDYGEWLVKII